MTTSTGNFQHQNVSLHYEVHGGDSRPKVLCMGGWGSFCHGRFGDVPRYLRENYQVLIWDYRGLGQSTDDPSTPISMKVLASDAAALVTHLGWVATHVVGMVGMGACVGQELAMARPELVRSLLMTGTWAFVDDTLRDQLELFRDVHQQMGFDAFQKLCAVYSFTGEFYAEHSARLLGPDGAWGDLMGKADAHARLVDACLGHDARGRLDRITCPTFVLHAALDPVTSPRTTLPLEAGIPGCQGELWTDLAHVIAGKDMKVRFDALLRGFLESCA
jgi:3-oxoadipate enol-lactonase